MIEPSSLRDPSSESMTIGTPSKSRVSTVGNEENQENMIQSCQTPLLSTPSKRDSTVDAPSTVSARREWLRDFGNKSMEHYHSGASRKPTNFEAHKSCDVLLRSISKGKRPMTSSAAADSSNATQQNIAQPIKRNFTPRKKLPVAHNGVEATDDGVASVAKLSQWLASDPTKKVVNVRRGRQVSYKSRNFERGRENVIVRENHIQRGSVTDKKNWLKQAFHAADEEEQVDELTSRLNRQYAKSEVGVYDPSSTRYAKSEIAVSRPSNMTVAAKKDWLRKAFKSAADASNEDQKDQEEPRSFIITDDAASCLSVSDKKSWLQSAFKKSEGTPSKKSGGASQRFSGAASDIVHSRGESRDEIAARAKKRFLQRSTRAGASGNVGTPSKRIPVRNSPVRHTPTKHTPTKRRAGTDPRVLGPQIEEKIDEMPRMDRTNDSTENRFNCSGSIVEPKRILAVEEDKTSVDFRAARELLVQRGRKNAKRIEVVNKVYFKKTKFEDTKSATEIIPNRPPGVMPSDVP